VDLQKDIVDVARTAEAAGFSSLWVYERALYPMQPKERYYDGAGIAWPEYYRQTADPLIVLATAAAVTTKVRLGTGVLVAPLHQPFELAKSLATLDQISGGRMIAGLGIGWSSDEFQTVCANRADRGRLMDEMLDALAAAWGPDPVNFHSSQALVENAVVLPKPVSKIPVLVGGSSAPRTQERIARRADGWLSIPWGPNGIDDVAATWLHIRELASEFGRDADRLRNVVIGNVTFADRPMAENRPAFVGTLDEIVEDIVAVAETGAPELVIDINLQDRWFTDSPRMLETALEIRERATAAGI
jgi:probable F420-dependent oxidoreductase